MVLPSGWYHLSSIGSKAGRSVLKQSRLMAIARLPRRAFSLNTVSIGGMELSLGGGSRKFHLILFCHALNRPSLTFTVTHLVACQYEDLVASPLVGYALSLNVLIRQINLAQRWREWLLSTIAVDYLIFLIRTNGIGYVSRYGVSCLGVNTNPLGLLSEV